MKLLPLALSAAALSAAQNIHIRRPRPGASLAREAAFPVVVQTPSNASTPIQPLSLVISILPCPSSSCPNAGDTLGQILYTGAFHPQAPAPASASAAGPAPSTPEQTFNVTVPATFPVGTAELLATQFVLIGDAHAPFLQIAGEIVYVEDD
ncbi:hypothetical protein E4U41_001209 [Claviceps citrina]|nr:hypothetical protein E4U41_001209 [Claviceps citrina]